jgi:thymidylate synthase ThyX
MERVTDADQRTDMRAQGAAPPLVQAVIHAMPEVCAFGLAQASRSADRFNDRILRLTDERSGARLEEIYVGYGHKSVAGLGHLALTLEDITMLGAFAVFDEVLQDGQESSTRYQDFHKRGFWIPPEIRETDLEKRFVDHCLSLIWEYEQATRIMVEFYERTYGGSAPDGLDPKRRAGTLNARAFDVSRYLLPCAARTSMGVVMSARIVEQLINRLLASRDETERLLGEHIRTAVKDKPAYNVIQEKLRPVIDALMTFCEERNRAEALAKQIAEICNFDAPAASTMVKYTQYIPFYRETWVALEQMVDRLDSMVPPWNGEREPAKLLDFGGDIELELAATLLFRVDGYRSLDHWRHALTELPSAVFREVLDLAFQYRKYTSEYRGKSVERSADLYAELQCGYRLVFDTVYDFGAQRDLHRNRKIVHVLAPFVPGLGWDIPEDAKEAGLGALYTNAYTRADAVALDLERVQRSLGKYALTLGHRRRHVMKTDYFGFHYLVENRTPTDRHFSYRNVVLAMLDLVRPVIPNLAERIEAVTTQMGEVDFWRR